MKEINCRQYPYCPYLLQEDYIPRGTMLQMYVDWYNEKPEVTRQEFYASWYGSDCYKDSYVAGKLDEYLTKPDPAEYIAACDIGIKIKLKNMKGTKEVVRVISNRTLKDSSIDESQLIKLTIEEIRKEIVESE